MGLEATVMCNCLKENKTTPAPVSKDLIQTDEEGYPFLNLPYEGNELKHREFEDWMENCCEHPKMTYQEVYISNWGGYRLFKQTLFTMEGNHFQILKVELPETNAGKTPANFSKVALEELNYFKNLEDIGSNFFLVDSQTGTPFYEFVIAHQGIFLWNSTLGLNFGLDPDGFFILDMNGEKPTIVFRSNKFGQKLVDSNVDPTHDTRDVIFVDLDSGKKYECKQAISYEMLYSPGEEHEMQKIHPKLMHVEEKPIPASSFDYIVEPLETIFKASVETGNPVRWS